MPPLARNVLKLVCICFCLWFFFAVLTPFMEDRIPAWKRYNRIQEEQGLDSGALYYSNVPQTQEAEINMRRAVREGMDERIGKKIRERENEK